MKFARSNLIYFYTVLEVLPRGQEQQPHSGVLGDRGWGWAGGRMRAQLGEPTLCPGPGKLCELQAFPAAPQLWRLLLIPPRRSAHNPDLSLCASSTPMHLTASPFGCLWVLNVPTPEEGAQAQTRHHLTQRPPRSRAPAPDPSRGPACTRDVLGSGVCPAQSLPRGRGPAGQDLAAILGAGGRGNRRCPRTGSGAGRHAVHGRAASRLLPGERMETSTFSEQWVAFERLLFSFVFREY